MRTTHSPDKNVTNYALGVTLKDTWTAVKIKDLGVRITKDLSWGNHISMTVNKANKIQGTIRRCVDTANATVFCMLYMQISCVANLGIHRHYLSSALIIISSKTFTHKDRQDWLLIIEFIYLYG